MTTLTPASALAPTLIPIATTAHQGIPMRRLVAVERRKALNTRAGKWLLGAIAGGSALVMTIMAIVGLVNDTGYTFTDFMAAANFFPMALLLPVLGILSVTSEWSQRTNMVTFTLEPRRSRIVIAKLLTGGIMAVAATLIALATALLTMGVFDLLGGDATWNFSFESVVAFGLLQVIGLFTGFAFGMLILNTPAAIVSLFAYSFLLPTIFILGSSLWSWADSIRPWLDYNYTQDPLMQGSLSGVNWAQFAVTSLIWFVAPVALGVRRLLRAEIK